MDIITVPIIADKNLIRQNWRSKKITFGASVELMQLLVCAFGRQS